MLTALVPIAPPVIPPVTTGNGQVYVVPAGTIPFTPFAGADVNVPPLQIAATILVTPGVGLTVTVTVNVAPVHPATAGVTVYVAVCAVLVGFVRVLLMFAAFVPIAPPVIPPVTTGNGQV